MTDADAWEAYCAAGEPPPFVCNECGATIEGDDDAEIEAHRDEHWFDFLRSQCPIPPAPLPTLNFAAINAHLENADEEVPF